MDVHLRTLVKIVVIISLNHRALILNKISFSNLHNYTECMYCLIVIGYKAFKYSAPSFSL